MVLSLYFLMVSLNCIMLYVARLFIFDLQRFFPGPVYEFKLPLDNYIPFLPQWVWVYNGVYYMGLLALNLSQSSFLEFFTLDLVFVLLIFTHLVFFAIIPSSGPEIGRRQMITQLTKRDKAEQYLSYIYSVDMNVFCLPSIHSSSSMLAAVILAYKLPALMPLLYAFPVLIGISSLLIKQHYLLDVVAGWLLGWCFGQYYKAILLFT